jgi:hypothetical protein
MVRDREDAIVEHITKNSYSRNLDTSIFEHNQHEEIILCLNYDGLYGINNINRLLQENNPQTAIAWGIHKYKVGDPILFNESNRFYPLIYNNMKGRIIQQQVIHETNEIQFDIELERAISGMDADGYDFALQGNSASGNSIIRFNVSRYKSTDDDDDGGPLAGVSGVLLLPLAWTCLSLSGEACLDAVVDGVGARALRTAAAERQPLHGGADQGARGERARLVKCHAPAAVEGVEDSAALE